MPSKFCLVQQVVMYLKIVHLALFFLNVIKNMLCVKVHEENKKLTESDTRLTNLFKVKQKKRL